MSVLRVKGNLRVKSLRWQGRERQRQEGQLLRDKILSLPFIEQIMVIPVILEIIVQYWVVVNYLQILIIGDV